MNDLFQISLYLFSAMLQADAAVLGFGAIFVIFKIQTLDSVRRSIIEAYHQRGPSSVGKINILVLSDDHKLVAEILDKAGRGLDFKNYKYVRCIPRRMEQIGRSFRCPVWVIGTHACYCATALYLSQFTMAVALVQQVLLVVALLWFGLALLLAARLAIRLAFAGDQYSIKDLESGILEHVADKEDPAWTSTT